MKLETARKFYFKIYPSDLKRGLFYGYPICCIMYFQYIHVIMKYIVPEMIESPGVRVMCPDCIVRSLQ